MTCHKIIVYYFVIVIIAFLINVDMCVHFCIFVNIRVQHDFDLSVLRRLQMRHGPNRYRFAIQKDAPVGKELPVSFPVATGGKIQS